MKNKLIELIERAMDEGFEKHIPLTSSFLADQLIANNVFVLPEKMKDSWELALPFMVRLFVADEAEIEKIKREFECQSVKQILTEIRNYLVAIIDEWYKRIDEPNFYEQNIGVYNHIRKEMYDLEEYAKKLGVEL